MRLPPNVTKHEWGKARAQVIAEASVCAICGRGLQPFARPRSRWSTAVDHIVPRSVFMKTEDLETQRFLCLDPSNLRVTHAVCNGRRGAKQLAVVQPRLQSQVW